MENTKELYSKSYKEVITILSCLPQEDYEKIPAQKIKFYIDNMKKDYKFKYDYTKSIIEQNVLNPTRAILANIFKTYIATPEEKKEILTVEKQQFDLIEAEKRRKYNPDNIFKNKEEKSELVQNEQIVQETAMVEYKESIFTRIKNWFKGLFGRK